MDLIEFKDKPDLSTPINKTNLNHNFGEIKTKIEEIDAECTKHYIIATSTGTINANGNTDIELIQTSKNGTKLTFEDGKIKIGEGITKVRISASIFLDITYVESAGYIWGRIAKNNSNILGSIQPITTNMAFISAPIPSNIIDVVEGDIFHLNADVSNVTGIVRNGNNNTWLCVEVIE